MFLRFGYAQGRNDGQKDKDKSKGKSQYGGPSLRSRRTTKYKQGKGTDTSKRADDGKRGAWGDSVSWEPIDW
jgi:hypothetical protein